MPIKLANNATSTIATAINASDVGVVLATGDGAKFPALAAGEYFYITFESTGGTYEIAKATARAGDSLTIVRAQEGTTAQSFAAGSRVELRVTAASINDLIDEHDQASEISFVPTGTISATNVQAAIAEVSGDVTAFSASSGSSLVGHIASGSGATARTVQAKLRDTVSVKDFGAVGDGVTDDTTAIQAAVTAGNTVLFPAGNYRVTSQILCTSGNWLVGEGASETFISAVGNVSPFLFQDPSVSDYTGAGISKLTIRGNGATVCLVEVIDIWGFVAEYCSIYGQSAVQDCLRISKFAFEAYINSCRITDADRYGIYLQDDGGQFPNGTTIINCDLSGNDGCTLIRSEANNVKIIGVWFEYAGTDGGTCISATKRLHIIGNKITTGADGDNSIYLASTVRGALIQNNRIVCNGSTSKGIFLDQARDVVIQGNQFVVDSCDDIIHCKGSDAIVIQGNVSQLIVGGIYGITNAINLTDAASNTVVDANTFNYSGTATGVGVQIANGCTNSKVTKNTFAGFVKGIDCNTNATAQRAIITDNSVFSNTTPIEITNQVDVFIKNNPGFVTENRGTETIASGGTNVVINHGLGVTPSANRIIITPTNNPTNDPGNLYISGSPSSTDFAVACRSDPGASGATFGWRVSISE